MSKINQMYDRAVAIAEENGFTYVDLFIYTCQDPKANHEELIVGLKIQPYLNHAVSIEVNQVYVPYKNAEPIILSPLEHSLLEPIMKALIFAAKGGTD